MTDKQPTSRLTDFASSANAAILLSVLYPTLFAFSQNWHTASGREWVFLAALAFAFGLVIAALYHVLTPFAAVLLSRVAGLEETKAKAIAQAILLAVACVVPFFLLFDGTFRDMLGGPRRVLALQIAALAAAAWLFRAGHAAKYSAVLAMASAVSIVSFAATYLFAPSPTPARPRSLRVRISRPRRSSGSPTSISSSTTRTGASRSIATTSASTTRSSMRSSKSAASGSCTPSATTPTRGARH